MEQNNPNFPQTTFCRSGCGFYGSDSFDGLCSKCHKDKIEKQQQSSSPVSSTGRDSPSSIGTSAGPVKESSGSMSRSSSSVLVKSGSKSQIFETATTTIQVPNIDKDHSEEAAGGAEVNSDSNSSDVGKDKKKKNRCDICKKKTGLTGFECRCGGLYCSLHRYSDKHECTFNYKEMAQEQIRKNNPVIVGEKIQKL